jgi:hypothetical protein
MSVRLYAVLRLQPRSSAALPPGLEGERLRLVRCKGFAVAVADCRSPLAPAADNLIEFDRIIRALSSLSKAILPARFGVVVRDAALLKSEIADRAEVLASALDDVAGRVQMTVRMPADSARSPANAEAASVRRRSSRKATSSGGKRGRGSKYLRARAAASTSPALTTLRKALSDLVRGERIEPGPGVTSVYHLIERADVATYRARIPGLHVSGPFPPYAFVPGIDHAIWPGHDDEKAQSANLRSPRSRARRRGTGNANR